MTQPRTRPLLALPILLAAPAALHAGLTAVVPDDFATIQQAVDHVENDSDAGTVVVRSNGTFTESVRIRQSVTLRAAPGYRPVLQFDRYGSTVKIDPSQELTTFVKIEGITVRALNLDGRGAYNGVGIVNDPTEAALLLYLNDVEIEVVSSNYGIAVWGSGGYIYLQVSDSTVDVQGDGSGSPACVSIDPSNRSLDVFLWGNTFRFSGANGIAIEGGADGTQTSTTIDRNRFFAYESDSGEGWSAIEIDGTGSQGSSASPTRTTATNNLIVGAQTGIEVAGQSQHVHTIFANNNTIVSSRYSAIDLSANGDSRVVARLANNVIVGSGESGFTGSRSSNGVLDQYNQANLFFDNAVADFDGVKRGPGTLFTDPRFVDPAGLDYRLRIGSPAVDAGNDLPDGGVGSQGRDLPGVERILDGNRDGAARIDLGAHELSESIFSDGFESGSCAAWSAAAAGC